MRFQFGRSLARGSDAGHADQACGLCLDAILRVRSRDSPHGRDLRGRDRVASPRPDAQDRVKAEAARLIGVAGVHSRANDRADIAKTHFKLTHPRQRQAPTSCVLLRPSGHPGRRQPTEPRLPRAHPWTAPHPGGGYNPRPIFSSQIATAAHQATLILVDAHAVVCIPGRCLLHRLTGRRPGRNIRPLNSGFYLVDAIQADCTSKDDPS